MTEANPSASSLALGVAASRRRYGWIAGVAMWLAALLSLLFGTGVRDATGHVIGPDFLAFYTAGILIAGEGGAELYDFRRQHQVQQEVVGKEWQAPVLYVNPPFYAWLFVPFTRLPYKTAVLSWMGLGLALIALGIWTLGLPGQGRTWLWAMTFYPVLAGVLFGQNAPLSLCLLCCSLALWMRGQRFTAGAAASLVLYKPQLLVGLGLLWLLEWRKEWRTLAGLTVGGAVLATVSLTLMPAASWGYLAAGAELLSDYPPWHAYATRTFWMNLLGGASTLSDALYLIGAVAGVRMFVRLWQRTPGAHALHFGAAICLTLWLTPHLMVYDWSLLLIPAIALWHHAPEERAIWLGLFALMWTAAFVSGPLVLLQLTWLPVSLQVSLPVLAVAGGLTASRLTRRREVSVV